MVRSLAPAFSIEPSCGWANGAGAGSLCASLGNAPSTSAFFMPQRASRHTGGGVGTGVGVGAGGTVVGTAVGTVCWETGAGSSFLLQEARTAATARNRAPMVRRWSRLDFFMIAPVGFDDAQHSW